MEIENVADSKTRLPECLLSPHGLGISLPVDRCQYPNDASIPMMPVSP